ncbi:MAG: hypothetical protein C0601_05010 [Candidatus Muiribacterium halophilum]|uniref:Uncharacterized protein n=1 Tax=Muiribacterium halophilum TaxID=2053465 RepID=A0A2N5ZIC8_MUIH1|nr:MAG: hypothetical protein C0601_05010 [Candidatus Muirbacterium halophilum]
MKFVDKLKSRGVEKIELIYDWGDGNKDVLPISQIAKEMNHFYEKEGNYTLTTKLVFYKDGETFQQVVETRPFYYKKETIDYELKVKVPEEAVQGKESLLKAQIFVKEPGVEIKNVKYQWFIDEENNQYEEGSVAVHIFRIPNGPEKHFYNIRLRTVLKYQYMNNPGVWLPLEVVRNFKVKVKKSTRIKIIEFSKFLNVKNNKFTSPFFIVMRDDSYYTTEDFYKKTNLWYKPIIYIDGKTYNAKFVDVKREQEKGVYFNKLIYMLELDDVKVNIKRNRGKRYVDFNIKISDPQGLVEKRALVEIR